MLLSTDRREHGTVASDVSGNSASGSKSLLLCAWLIYTNGGAPLLD